LQQLKKKDLIDADKATEEKISTAVSGRTAVAVQVSFAYILGLFCVYIRSLLKIRVEISTAVSGRKSPNIYAKET
jgi:phage FluMu protein gp41